MISVIFPAYNEAQNLERFPKEVLPVFERLGMPFEIIVVDDGSADETARTAEGLGGRVRVVRHEKNQGLGAAVRTGIRAARGDLIVTMDTDLTFAPELVASLLERHALGDADVISGSPKLAGYGSDIPSYRLFVSHAATLVYRLIMGAKVTSVSPIFRLYKAEQLKALQLEATGFDINAEILFRLIQSGQRVIEIPAPLTVRKFGESKLNYSKEMRRHIKLLLKILRWRIGL